MAAVISHVSDFNAETDTENVSPFTFTVDGLEYTLDLGDEGRKAYADANEKAEAILAKAYLAVEKALKPFLDNASLVETGKNAKTGDGKAALCRKWALSDTGAAALAQRGFKVGERGRIPAEVWALWRSETGQNVQ